MSRKPVDVERLYATLDANHGNMKKTADELGLAYRIVVDYKNRRMGLCPCGRKRDDESLVLCENCRARYAKYAKRDQGQRRAAGMCIRCGRVAVAKRVLCAECAERVKDVNSKHMETSGAERMWGRRIAALYGPDAIEAYEASEGKCQACGVEAAHRKHHHIHHIDGNDRHNTRENFAILCTVCHALVHRIAENPAREKVLELASHLP